MIIISLYDSKIEQSYENQDEKNTHAEERDYKHCSPPWVFTPYEMDVACLHLKNGGYL